MSKVKKILEILFSKTDTVNDHHHLAELDGKGNGVTIKTYPSGHDHVHKVVAFQALEEDGHTHKVILGEDSQEQDIESSCKSCGTMDVELDDSGVCEECAEESKDNKDSKKQS